MKQILKLAIPVSLSFFLTMSLGLMDVWFVGRISTSAIGAVGLGTTFFNWFSIFGIAILSALDYFVAHAYGSQKTGEAEKYWVQGLWLALLITIPLTLILGLLALHLDLWGLNATVIPATRSYLLILSLSLLPMLIFTACKSYLQAIEKPQAPLTILILSNFFNAFFNYLFVFGNWGFPRWEADGSAFATLLTRLFMMGAGIYFCRPWLFVKVTYRFDLKRCLEICKLGFPSSIQWALEMGIFGLVTILVGKLSLENIAAHQIVLNIASAAFMIPLGIGASATVLIGQNLGQKNDTQAVRIGWLSLALGVGFMACSGLSMMVLQQSLITPFSDDPLVVNLGVQILGVVAIFQIFDGAQTILSGAMRGFANSHSALYSNLIGHWCVGLPIGYTLCFIYGKGLWGLWVGLASGLITVSILLLGLWLQKIGRVVSSQ